MNKQMLNTIGNLIFIISPAIGYIPQIISNNIVFSPLLSLILIVSGLMRILYFQVESFKLPILFQSIALILTQLILIFNYKHRLGVIESKFYALCRTEKFSKKHSLFTTNILLLTTIFFLCHMFGYLTTQFYSLCGIIGAVLESSIGLLQIYFRRADQKYLIGEEKRRMPKELFACWIVGDVLKACWMYYLNSKNIFFVPILFQIVVDGFLMFE